MHVPWMQFCGKSTVKAVVGIADELLKRQDKYKEVSVPPQRDIVTYRPASYYTDNCETQEEWLGRSKPESGNT